MTRFTRWLAVVGVLTILALAVACSSDDTPPAPGTGVITQTPNVVPSVGGPQEQPPPAQALDTQPVQPSDGVVEIAASGTLFTHNLIKIDPGQSVVIRVTNQDAGVTHDLRIAGVDGQYQTEDDAVTTPDAIEFGKTGEVTFAPPAQGAYTFHCDFHPNSMGGEIIVGDATPVPAQ